MHTYTLAEAYLCIIEGGKSSVLISRFTPIGKNIQANRRIQHCQPTSEGIVTMNILQ